MTFHRGSRAGYLSDVAAVRFFTPLLHGCVTRGLHLLYPISSTTVSHFKKLCCRTFQSWYCIWKRALANSARVLRSHSLGGAEQKEQARETVSQRIKEGVGFLLELAFFEISCPCGHCMMCLLSLSSHSAARREACCSSGRAVVHRPVVTLCTQSVNVSCRNVCACS